MATWAQRQTAATAILAGGFGVTALPLAATDFIYTKDPRGVVPTAGGVTPVGGETTPAPGWILWAGVEAATAYGV